jgi:hypothetical protein
VLSKLGHTTLHERHTTALWDQGNYGYKAGETPRFRLAA